MVCRMLHNVELEAHASTRSSLTQNIAPTIIIHMPINIEFANFQCEFPLILRHDISSPVGMNAIANECIPCIGAVPYDDALKMAVGHIACVQLTIPTMFLCYYKPCSRRDRESYQDD